MHESTGFTPNELMLGRNVRLPTDLVYGRPDDYARPINDFVEKQLEHIESVHHQARKNIALASIKHKKTYDHRTECIGFQTKDEVWYYRPVRKVGLSPKLQNDWLGPCTITERISDILYRIRLPHSRRTVVVHLDKLKKYESNNWQNEHGSELKPVTEPIKTTQPSTSTYMKYITQRGRESKPPMWYGVPNG